MNKINMIRRNFTGGGGIAGHNPAHDCSSVSLKLCYDTSVRSGRVCFFVFKRGEKS